MTKHEAIKAAYGEYWAGLSNEQQKYALENNGWIDVKPNQYQMDMFTRLKFNKNKHSVRPKSLSGIETNNGWTRVESEDDLPKDRSKEDLLIFTETGEVLVASSKYLSDPEIRRYWIKTVSHWQKFIKPNPPIF
ncbi:hypothetical protein CMU45_02745 [Elizabethkingia anophelis]|nr:hypothetical protein [Elizabethkingia anophelis]